MDIKDFNEKATKQVANNLSNINWCTSLLERMKTLNAARTTNYAEGGSASAVEPIDKGYREHIASIAKQLQQTLDLVIKNNSEPSDIKDINTKSDAKIDIS